LLLPVLFQKVFKRTILHKSENNTVESVAVIPRRHIEQQLKQSETNKPKLEAAAVKILGNPSLTTHNPKLLTQ
jgi:hypothetical protein